MKKLYIISAILFLAACSKEEILEGDVCLTGDCEAVFYIDTTLQPDLYQDDNGYYHINYWGPNYFTIKGNLDTLVEKNVVNGIPLTETRFDSDYWMAINGLTFTVPLYEPFGFFYDDTFTDPVPVGDTVIKFCDISKYGEVLNIAGYSYNDNVCGTCPWSDIIMGSYSKNTYTPQQQFFLNETMVGDTLKIFIKTDFNYDTYTTGESEVADYEFNIIVD